MPRRRKEYAQVRPANPPPIMATRFTCKNYSGIFLWYSARHETTRILDQHGNGASGGDAFNCSSRCERSTNCSRRAASYPNQTERDGFRLDRNKILFRGKVQDTGPDWFQGRGPPD